MESLQIKKMIVELSNDLGFSPEDLKELCFTFSEEMSEEINKLRAAYVQKDYETLKGVSHNIKGVSANMKLTPLFEVARDMNDDLKSGHYDKLESYINTLELLLPFITEGINDYYKE